MSMCNKYKYVISISMLISIIIKNMDNCHVLIIYLKIKQSDLLHENFILGVLHPWKLTKFLFSIKIYIQYMKT